MTARPTTPATRGQTRTALACLAFALAMVGAAYASVPLYSLFCRLTGFDGTPLVGTTAPAGSLARTMQVRFDVNVAPGLGWSFTPETPSISARIGDTQTVFFKVRNEGRRASTGIATFNVQPHQSAAYFVKMKCFCFEEQTLEAGEAMDFPVVFYIDPALAENGGLDGLNTITLSYTYFASRNGQPVASVAGKSQL